ncbi:SBBP repeat-containing protein [Paraflavisolibacter sp. H34]|uniref:SBBP repeat-containing protein n=1 Tax=Huijunlia imazamoxiresistens TaxID=3127457 RepID=UPI003018D964
MKKRNPCCLQWLFTCLLLLPALAFAQVSTAGTKRYDFSTALSSDIAYSLAVDGSGNTYITGESGNQFGTVKYGPDGSKKWMATYGGPTNYNSARALAVDALGNVYVTGTSDGGATDHDYATLQYNASGT